MASRCGLTFGVRLAISAPVVASDDWLDRIRERWQDLVAPGPGGDAQTDPDLLLSDLIAAEPDRGRRASLEALQLELRRARDRAQTARLQSARSTLLSGAMFVGALRGNSADIEAKAANIRMLVELQRAGGGSDTLDRQIRAHVARIGDLRKRQAALLLSYRAVLDALVTGQGSYERTTAHDVLREELILSGQSAVLGDLDRFWGDLAAFEARPDMAPKALLGLAVE